MKRLFCSLVTALLLLTSQTFSQSADWKFSLEKTSGNMFEVVMEISIPNDFHMYSFDQAAGGPIAARVEFQVPDGVKKVGGLKIRSEQPDEFFDDIFEVNIRQFANRTVWAQRFEVTKDLAPSEITGSYSYQLCKDDGFCLNPLPEKFSVDVPAFKLPEPPKQPDVVATDTANRQPEVLPGDSLAESPALEEPVDSVGVGKEDIATLPTEPEEESRSLLVIFLLGFLGGILAFLTPCVFPMVPMTVSMFLRRDKNHALRDVLVYGLSIILIFVLLGLCITLLFGVDALNKMSTSPAFNMVFFVVFIVFAVSFFGVFELMLPSGLVNYFDKKADSTTGFLSIFFMAFTLVLVSFSCTAMIIGTLLVESVVSGSVVGPLVGMIGFAVALALPFVVFAAVPSLLSSLSKSGDWMNDVKVSLGFVELAFALKFLSKADLVANWGLLSRDMFLSVWVILLVLWGLSILRVIRLGYAEKKPLTKARVAVAVAIFAFAAYLVPGVLGKPIDLISGYLPPMTTQRIHILSEKPSNAETQAQKKYGTVFHSPYNIDGFYDYEEGLAYAKSAGKPVLLDFTGLGCENCRKIEMNVWSKPEILSMIKDDYVLVSLYLDSREPLEPSLVRTETYGDKTYDITTVGEHWSIFMMKRYHGLMQPYYVLLSPDERQLCPPITYSEAKDAETFRQFLLKGLAEYRKGL